MLRNIHFFNIKPGADEKRMLYLMNEMLGNHAKRLGCLERKTWKLLSSKTVEPSMGVATYMNEALWPSQKVADGFASAVSATDEERLGYEELYGGIELLQTLRYVDDLG